MTTSRSAASRALSIIGERPSPPDASTGGVGRVAGDLGGFGHRCRVYSLHRPHIDVEQGVVLVALVLVLLAKPDDLLQDLHVKALALGFGEDLFFCSVSSCSMRSTNERMRSPAIPTGSDMVSPSSIRARTIQPKGKHLVKVRAL